MCSWLHVRHLQLAAACFVVVHSHHRALPLCRGIGDLVLVYKRVTGLAGHTSRVRCASASVVPSLALPSWHGPQQVQLRRYGSWQCPCCTPTTDAHQLKPIHSTQRASGAHPRPVVGGRGEDGAPAVHAVSGAGEQRAVEVLQVLARCRDGSEACPYSCNRAAAVVFPAPARLCFSPTPCMLLLCAATSRPQACCCPPRPMAGRWSRCRSRGGWRARWCASTGESTAQHSTATAQHTSFAGMAPLSVLILRCTLLSFSPQWHRAACTSAPRTA